MHKFFLDKNITKKDYYNVLKELSKKLNKYYNTDDIKIICEQYDKGTLTYSNYDNSARDYKSIRMYFLENRGTTTNYFGHKHSENIEDWKNDDTIHKKRGLLGHFSILTRGAAPKFNFNELSIFFTIFRKYGILIKTIDKIWIDNKIIKNLKENNVLPDVKNTKVSCPFCQKNICLEKIFVHLYHTEDQSQYSVLMYNR